MSNQAFNPYAAPSAEADTEILPGFDPELMRLATPGQRWAGAFLDQLMIIVPLFPMILLFSDLSEDDARVALAAGPSLVLLIVQWVLVSKNGQSLGKRLIRTRIVLRDGSNPGFVRGVLLRSWLPFALQVVPGVGGVFGLLDALFVFRRDRRTIHDQIAGTMVIKV